MIRKIAGNLHWLPSYLIWEIQKLKQSLVTPSKGPRHVFFSICDHFEPYWRNTSKVVARQRISRWIDEYPKIAEKYKDSDGQILKYSFFYPEEEYQYDDMEALAGMCHEGFGEVEIHLHHDNDNSANLRKTLNNFKRRLFLDHGLLSQDKDSSDISYGFIHGNWALDNSRPDGRLCGVNDELSILQETGCYADFTMPSAPDVTQTKKINSIYYAVDNPLAPKSHDNGRNSKIGVSQDGLLMIQGPLCLNFKNRKLGLFPKIENSGIVNGNPPSRDRVLKWLDCNVHIEGVKDWTFVKIYTHGTQESIMDMLFKEAYLERMFDSLLEYTETFPDCKIHFVSAREMVNVIKAVESGLNTYSPSLRDFRFQKIIH